MYRTLVTNESGFYSVPNLLPGPYEVRVVFVGFNTAVEKLNLTVASTTQNVLVAGEAPAVNLTSSALSATVGGQTVRELPLNGRGWTTLAAFEAGVHAVDTQTQIVAGSNARPNGGWGTQLTFSGARPQQDNYRLDGININDYCGGGLGSTLGLNLSVDAIQQFSVVTGNASADYGKTSGAFLTPSLARGPISLMVRRTSSCVTVRLDARNFLDRAGVPLSAS